MSYRRAKGAGGPKKGISASVHIANKAGAAAASQVVWHVDLASIAPKRLGKVKGRMPIDAAVPGMKIGGPA